MALDPVLNFAKCTVSTGYDASATSIVLSGGDGAKLPAPASNGAFNLVWWNSTDYPDPADDPNKEIVRCTARSTDTLTVTRNQESSGASTKNTDGKTYKMILAMTKKMVDDINNRFVAVLGDVLMANSDAEVSTSSSTYVLLKQINLGMFSGDLRIKFTMKLVGGSPRTATGRIYRNESGIGTERVITTDGQITEYSEDITGWSVSDRVEIYAKSDGGYAYITNFRIYVAVNLFPRVVT